VLSSQLQEYAHLIHYSPGVYHFSYQTELPPSLIPTLRHVLSTITGISWDIHHRENVRGETLRTQQKRQHGEEEERWKNHPGLAPWVQTFQDAGIKIEKKSSTSTS